MMDIMLAYFIVGIATASGVSLVFFIIHLAARIFSVFFRTTYKSKIKRQKRNGTFGGAKDDF